MVKRKHVDTKDYISIPFLLTIVKYAEQDINAMQNNGSPHLLKLKLASWGISNFDYGPSA